MPTLLTPYPKGAGDQSMQGRPRRRKSPLLWVVRARRVWRKLDCLNPSPTDLSWDPNGRWLLTLGPAARLITRIGEPTHHRWRTRSRRERANGAAWSTSYLRSVVKAGLPTQEKDFLHGNGASVVPKVGRNGYRSGEERIISDQQRYKSLVTGTKTLLLGGKGSSLTPSARS
jgi:hypothetical protein